MYVSVFFVRKYITGYVDVLRALNFLYKVASHHMLRATEIFSILKNGKRKSYISNFGTGAWILGYIYLGRLYPPRFYLPG